jgi:hypothetical protein
MIKIKQKQGYAAIVTVLIISFVVLSVGTTSALTAINSLTNTLSSYRGRKALEIVESCAEDALIRLNKDNTIPTSITLPQGTCAITPVPTGNNWNITIIGPTVDSHSKIIQITATRNDTITITSWKELP